MSGDSLHAAITAAARLLAAQGIDNARLDAEILAAHALACDRLTMLGLPPAPFAGKVRRSFDAMVQARAAGAPVAYITGRREFWGLDYGVCRNVLIPRPDSETLVEAVLQSVAGRNRALRVLDLGVGSGCLLLSLLYEWPKASGVGVDHSAAALAQAQANAARLDLAARAEFRLGDWWAALPQDIPPFDVIISNPPYVRRGDIAKLALDVRDHEPLLALDGGPDGLDAYRAILASVMPWLAPGGVLALEIGCDQAAAVNALMPAALAAQNVVVRDLAGHDRVVLSRLFSES